MSGTRGDLEPLPTHSQDDSGSGDMWDLSAAGAVALTSSGGGNEQYDDSFLQDAELTSGIELEQMDQGRHRNIDRQGERESIPESSTDSSESPSVIATPGGSMLAPTGPHHQGDSTVKQASFNFINAIIGALPCPTVPRERSHSRSVGHCDPLS